MHYFINSWDLSAGVLEITNRATVHQIAQVLKLRAGEKIVLGDGEGKAFDAEILIMNTKSVQVEILGESNLASEPSREVVLYCAILKKENFELVCQKATEVGAKLIVPLLTERVIKTDLNFERLEKIVKEAAEQSRRLNVPEVLQPVKFTDAVRELKNPADNRLCHFGGENSAGRRLPATVGIFIGPEGGFTEAEVNLARERGLEVVSLGVNILRAQTAATVAVWVVVNS